MVNRNVNWEKVSVYVALTLGFLTMIIYIADMKERIRAVEVHIQYLNK